MRAENALQYYWVPGYIFDGPGWIGCSDATVSRAGLGITWKRKEEVRGESSF